MGSDLCSAFFVPKKEGGIPFNCKVKWQVEALNCEELFVSEALCMQSHPKCTIKKEEESSRKSQEKQFSSPCAL
jgi:hypothetical protein